MNDSIISNLQGNMGVSSSYILPISHLKCNPSFLAGSKIWMVLRGNIGDMLFAHLYVFKVEQFEDGINTEDFLLTIDVIKSFRCVRSYNIENDGYFQGHTNNCELGLFEVKESFFDVLGDVVLKSISIKFQVPTKQILNRIPKPILASSEEQISLRTISYITTRFSLNEIWASGGKPKLSPFANFAYNKIISEYGQQKNDIFASILGYLDPSSLLVSESILRSNEKQYIKLFRKPFVDINIVPIDPDKIYARKYIAHENNYMNLSDAIEKTEHAEKRHQDIVRDLAGRLLIIGMTPMQSSSIDLLIQNENYYIAFEIKSSNSENLLSQSAKGAFQLACYRKALIDEGYVVKYLGLVLEKVASNEINKYIYEILKSNGVRTFYYNKDVDWPERVKGFDSCLFD